MKRLARLSGEFGPTLAFCLVLFTAVVVDARTSPENPYRKTMQGILRGASPESSALRRWIRTQEELTRRREDARTHWEREGIESALADHEERLAEILGPDARAPVH